MNEQQLAAVAREIRTDPDAYSTRILETRRDQIYMLAMIALLDLPRTHRGDELQFALSRWLAQCGPATLAGFSRADFIWTDRPHTEDKAVGFLARELFSKKYPPNEK